VRIPHTPIRTTWRADWLVEFSGTLVVLGLLTREITFAAVGVGMLLILTGDGLLFHQRLGTLREQLQIAERLPTAKVSLGDSIEGDLTIRNGSRFDVHILAITPIVDKGLTFRLSCHSNQGLRPGTASSSKFQIVPLESGRFRIRGFTLTLADTRGLFAEEVKYAQTELVEAGPPVGRKAPLSPLRLYGESSDTSRTGSSGADYAGTRDYAAGDEYHRIEWKATARLRRLVVKEFHPETQTALLILIDTGRTMGQQSYVGSRLDEAFAIAWLLTESAAKSGNRVGIWFYNETEIARVMTPAPADVQLVKLRDLVMTRKAQTMGKENVLQDPRTRALWLRTLNLTGIKPLAMFARQLKLRLGLRYRQTGLFKALTETARKPFEGFIIILTDFGAADALSYVLRLLRKERQTIIVQIGASWRSSVSLEEAYIEYRANRKMLLAQQDMGLTVLDLPPERLIEAIAQHVRGHAAAAY